VYVVTCKAGATGSGKHDRPFLDGDSWHEGLIDMEAVIPILTFIQFCVLEMHVGRLNNIHDMVLVGLE
jgi:hypothetical protein